MIQVCPKNAGFPRSNSMTWGWDLDHQSYSIGRGLDFKKESSLRRDVNPFLGP